MNGDKTMADLITVTLFTYGGTDDDGNEIEEPVVFEGYYNKAIKFFSNEDNLFKINKIYNDMPNGYIMIETEKDGRVANDAYEIMAKILEMMVY